MNVCVGGYLLRHPIDHFHYDVTHAKASGSCSKDCAQGPPRVAQSRENSNNPQKNESTCNAMAAESADHITSIMCIIERTLSDISDKPTFILPGHIKRQ